MIFLFYISVCYGILRRPMFDYSQECWRHTVCSAEWRVAIPWWKPRRNLRKHCQKRLLFSGRIFLRNFQRSHRSNQSYVGWPYSVSWKKYSTVCADILTSVLADVSGVQIRLSCFVDLVFYSQCAKSLMIKIINW